MAKLILALAQLRYASHLYNSSEARLWSLIHTNKTKTLSYLLLCDKSYTKQTTLELVQESKEQVTWFLYQRCREVMRSKNQSQWSTTREILSKEMTQDFFTEVHLLPGKLLLVVAMHPLVVSRANRLSRVEPSAGAAQPHTRRGSSKPRAPLEYPLCELPRRRINNPLQHLVRAPTISNYELNHLRCSKPSTMSENTEE
jgi:hypothetical protein